jgi:hypothetical protein
MGRLCGLQRNATHTLILSMPVTLIDSEVIVAPLFLDCEASCNSAYRNQCRQPLRISFSLVSQIAANGGSITVEGP